MAELANKTIRFEWVNCPRCGIPFAAAGSFIDERREDHESFYCPNGHSMSFPGESSREKLERQLAFERQSRKRWERRAGELELSRRAYKGQVTKIKRRVGKGVCPCCSRHFEDLHRHMEDQHPNWSGDTEGGEDA